jgi:DNA-binding MarR family transcriptional regulator
MKFRKSMRDNSEQLTLSGTGHCVCFQLRRTARTVTQLYDAALEPAGIRSTQFAMLVAIAKKEPIVISELAEVLAIDSTTLSRSLPTLRRMGHIKLIQGNDRRKRLVGLTAKGRRVLEHSVPLWEKVQREVVSRLQQPAWPEVEHYVARLKDVSEQVFKKQR